MHYQDIIRNRRSIRNYEDRTVPTSIIMDIVQEGTYAPSSGNEQPWHFIIVKDKALMRQLSDEAKAILLKRITSNPTDYASKYKAMLENPTYNIFYNAPSVVYILGDERQKNMRINCTLAASYLMMSATNRGLGTCWINFATFIHSSHLISELGIPDGFTIVAPIIMGYPTKVPSIPKRKEPSIIKILS